MHSLIESMNQKNRKKKVTDVRSGDTVRVYQKIKEGGKSRVQVFEGLVIATKNSNSANASITVRRMASGVGVEKTFLLHSPLVEKVDVVKRTKVNRNKLNFMRTRSGKAARLRSVAFDSESVNKPQMETIEEQRDKEIDVPEEDKDEAEPEAGDAKKADAKQDEDDKSDNNEKTDKVENPADADKPANDKTDEKKEKKPEPTKPKATDKDTGSK